MIRTVSQKDAKEICEIYNQYVLNTIVTFEEESVQPEDMLQRIDGITQKLPWIIYEENNHIIGYAYASEWKSRCAYKHSVESTVYLKNGASGKGIGSMLYRNLLNQLRSKNIHAVIGGIALPNESSVALHEKFGFEKIGQFKEVGYKFDQWIDVGYWELML